MLLSLIRDTLVVLTTVVTILGICTKTLNKFFLENIKCRYKMIPGKQSIFDTILKSIVYCGIAIVLFIAISMVAYTIFAKGSNINTNNFFDLNITVYKLIGLLIAILFYYLIISTIRNFGILEGMFIKRMGEKLNKDDDKRKISNRNLNYLFKYINDILNKFNNIGIKKLNAINIFIAIFLGALSIISIISYVVKGVNKEDIESICTISLIAITASISFIISLSLVNVIEILEYNCIYEIIIEQEIIICRCYLEYDEYYLIFQNEKERYINKSKIKEVRKIKERRR